MSDKAPAFIRTGTPLVTGPALAIAADELFGLTLNTTQAVVLSSSIGFVYYVVVRYLEEYNPKLGYLLGIAKKPAYSDQPSPSPDTGQAVEAVVTPEPEAEPAPPAAKTIAVRKVPVKRTPIKRVPPTE